MRRLLCFLLVLVMVGASFAGCSNNAGSSAAASTPEPAADTPDTAADTADEAELADTGTMTLYYSHSTDWADPIIEEFMETTGIKVELVQGGTSDLFAKVTAEAGNPQADVVWGGVVDTYEAQKKLLQPYVSGEIGNLKDAALSADHYWYGFDIGPMVMIYNPKLVSQEDAPTKWSDMLDEKWFGQIACADPTSSSSSFATMMAIIMAYGKDDGGGYEFIKGLVNNLDGKVIASSSGTFKGVADGEYLIGMTYEEGALRYVSAGADLAIVYPEEGTTVSPSGMGIIDSCKNLKSAQMFVDFVLSKQVQSQLGELNRRTVRLDVDDPDTMEPFENIPVVDYDLSWIAEHEAEFKDLWRDYLTS